MKLEIRALLCQKGFRFQPTINSKILIYQPLTNLTSLLWLITAFFVNNPTLTG